MAPVAGTTYSISVSRASHSTATPTAVLLPLSIPEFSGQHSVSSAGLFSTLACHPECRTVALPDFQSVQSAGQRSALTRSVAFLVGPAEAVHRSRAAPLIRPAAPDSEPSA